MSETRGQDTRHLDRTDAVDVRAIDRPGALLPGACGHGEARLCWPSACDPRGHVAPRVPGPGRMR